MANVAKDRSFPNPWKQLVLDYICTYARPANVNIPLKWCLASGTHIPPRAQGLKSRDGGSDGMFVCIYQSHHLISLQSFIDS